jgi:hypothetical protein
MNCLPPLERWDRGFESHLRYGCICVRLFCVCVVLCVGRGLATGWSPVQESYRLCKKFKKLKKRPKSNKELYIHIWIHTNSMNGESATQKRSGKRLPFEIKAAVIKHRNGTMRNFYFYQKFVFQLFKIAFMLKHLYCYYFRSVSNGYIIICFCCLHVLFQTAKFLFYTSLIIFRLL